MSVIRVENLTRDYGGGRGIFGLSFEVKEGEVFGYLGPNGAGKTTTIRHLMGFIKSLSGACSVGGLDCWQSSAQIQKSLGYIPGEISFFDDMTGTEYLRFVTAYRGRKNGSRQKELLELLELDPRGKIRKMSKGTRQKLGIVAALMHDPDILVLDEPTSGLDPLMQNRFIDLIRGEKKRGKTILLSSHMFEEVERTCDRIGIIREGRLVTVDAVETLRERHLRPYTVQLATEEEAAAFAEDFGGVRDGSTVTVFARQSLETIFLHYYGGNSHAE